MRKPIAIILFLKLLAVRDLCCIMIVIADKVTELISKYSVGELSE